MKKRMSIILIGMLLGSFSIVAQEQGKKQGHYASKERMKEMNEKAKEELNLSDDQAKKWNEIHEDFMKENESIRKDESLSQEDKRAKQQALRKNKDEAIQSILTKEQYSEFQNVKKDMRAEKRGGMQKGKGHNGGQRLQKAKADLNLSDDQAKQWDEIVSSYRSKMQSLKSDTSLDEDQKRSAFQSNKKGMEKELMAILNTEQQKQFKQEIDREKQKRKQSRDGGNDMKG